MPVPAAALKSCNRMHPLALLLLNKAAATSVWRNCKLHSLERVWRSNCMCIVLCTRRADKLLHTHFQSFIECKYMRCSAVWCTRFKYYTLHSCSLSIIYTVTGVLDILRKYLKLLLIVLCIFKMSNSNKKIILLINI